MYDDYLDFIARNYEQVEEQDADDLMYDAFAQGDFF